MKNGTRHENRNRAIRRDVGALAAALALAGCAPDSETRSVAESASANGDVAVLDASRGATSVIQNAPRPAGAIRFTVAGSGNAARYRVREQLMGRDRENDAVGETQQVTGAITIDSSGSVIPGQSRFVVSTSGLRSDSDRRDGYVRRRLLETQQHPTVELVPTALRGLPARLPSAGQPSGPITFELVGDLTVRGVTRHTTWRVTARQIGGQVTGTASTSFTFADFGITPPRVPIVLSVADTIGLEYDFTLTRDGTSAH
jgi:polyisoprenoid-binding protein YceI